MVPLNVPAIPGSRWILLGLVLLACSTPIRTERVAHSAAAPLTKLALVPVEPAPRFRGERGVTRELAAQLVTARVLDALNELRTFDVVPPGEVTIALAAVPDESLIDRNVRLNRTFGVQAVLQGSVSRFNQREGGPRGASRPAAVTFSLELRGADGLVIWRGTYDERQQSISDDPLSFARARSRRFQWVTAEALAQYGARALIEELPGPRASWK
jgi:hypothetical protein